eukprot:CAMPEP_0203899880 /NCGR_PEP_ID=MMETSP0359-20131031/42231_1 /ASSEMBLY_ACC=CAM_ASM_000338 /TAXON_ID=268821 /ORGANISM="Scrippsiella Hangoei, Strain SHTV-5" /LENGTH=206 /DNA_ID=CAMNT_0050823221 /DNA_START=1 /DNA_END=621 /DNA_ORIENTATION=-
MVRLSAWAPTVGTTARHSERPLLPPSAHLLPVVESGRGRGCGRGSGRGRGSAEPGGAAPSASAVAGPSEPGGHALDDHFDTESMPVDAALPTTAQQQQQWPQPRRQRHVQPLISRPAVTRAALAAAGLLSTRAAWQESTEQSVAEGEEEEASDRVKDLLWDDPLLAPFRGLASASQAGHAAGHLGLRRGLLHPLPVRGNLLPLNNP